MTGTRGGDRTEYLILLGRDRPSGRDDRSRELAGEQGGEDRAVARALETLRCPRPSLFANDRFHWNRDPVSGVIGFQKAICEPIWGLVPMPVDRL
jgi:hypothetical protein